MSMDLTTWSRRRQGGAVYLRSPDRDVVACVAPHVRGARSIATRFCELAATIPELRDLRSASDIHESITELGEYAQRVTLVTATTTWAIAMIIGEDEVVAIHASARRTDPTSIVDDLVRGYVTPWARERVRMVRHTTPAGWFGTRAPWATVWYSATRARIVVCDAVPYRSPAIETRSLLWPIAQATKHVERTVGAFSIQIQLIDGAREDIAVMHAIADSIEPFPEPFVGRAPSYEWMVA
jgi:hypothetical protein